MSYFIQIWLNFGNIFFYSRLLFTNSHSWSRTLKKISIKFVITCIGIKSSYNVTIIINIIWNIYKGRKPKGIKIKWKSFVCFYDNYDQESIL